MGKTDLLKKRNIDEEKINVSLYKKLVLLTCPCPPTNE